VDQVPACQPWREAGNGELMLVRRQAVAVGKDGVLTVYGPQAPVYGEAWMSVAMNAPLGQVQGPVQTKGGYSVFRVLERQPESHYGLDQSRVRRDVESGVEAEKERTQFNEYLDGLRRKNASRVRIYQDHLEMLAAPARADSARAPS
jgi:hypothetical protein